MTSQSEPNEPFGPTSEAVVDTWLADQHRDMGADLASTLDLGTGLRGILLAGQHRNMGKDLASMLNLDAGLAAILPHLRPHLSPSTQFSNLAALLDWLSTVPMVRLTHRNQLRLLAFDTEVLRLACTGAIDSALDCAVNRSRIRDLVLNRPRDLDRAGDYALELVRDLDRARTHIRVLDRALDRARGDALALVRILEHARILARELGKALTLARGREIVQALTLAGDSKLPCPLDVRFRDLVRALALARDLDLVRVRDLDRAHVGDRDRDIVNAVDLNLIRVRDQAYELVQLLCGMWVHLEVGDLLSAIHGGAMADTSWLDVAAIGTRETDRLNELAADFTGVDLREAKLGGLDLIGVRWSKTTRWPEDEVDWIVAASEPVGDGVYVIKESSAGGGVIVAPDPVSV